ncbi:MAG: GDP-mannose 4,6-dehydratase [Actinomycetota bacterium]|nr:GDP-mannose 4,6-dehydratase [Actinomycetota bacterium]
MRILVTGAAGFIGSNLVDRLLAEGHQVAGVDDLSSGRLDNLADARAVNVDRPGAFTFSRADITDSGFPALVARVGPEVICHLAAQIDVRVSVADPLRDARLNVLGTINVLEAARQAGTRKVIFTSSGGSIYGEPTKLPVSERAGVDPRSPYAAGKAAGELYLGTWRAMYGLSYTALALGNVFGPRQDPHGEAGVVAIFATALLEGRPTKIFGDGTSSRDYVYVDDVVDAFVRSTGSAGDGRRYNIGTGVATTVRELHTAIAAAVGAVDDPAYAEPRVGELQAIALDATAARAGIGWEPFTDVATGVAATVDWVRDQIAERR